MRFGKNFLLIFAVLFASCGKSSYTRKIKVKKEDLNFALMEYQYCPRGNIQLSEAQKTIEKMWEVRYLLAGELARNNSAVSIIPFTPPFVSFSYSHEILNSNLQDFQNKRSEHLLSQNKFLEDLSQLKETSDRLRYTYCQLEKFWKIPGDSLLAYNKIKHHTCGEKNCAAEKNKMCQLMTCSGSEGLDDLLNRFSVEIIEPRYQSIQITKRFNCQVVDDQKIISINVGVPNDFTKSLVETINRQYFQKENMKIRLIVTDQALAEVNIVWKKDSVSHVDMSTLNEVVLSEMLMGAPTQKIVATLAHEFGHILGLPDCYIEYFSNTEKKMFYFELDPTNLMCRASPENRFSEGNFAAIFKHHCQAD